MGGSEKFPPLVYIRRLWSLTGKRRMRQEELELAKASGQGSEHGRDDEVMRVMRSEMVMIEGIHDREKPQGKGMVMVPW